MLNMSWVNVELMLKKVQNEFIIYLKLKKNYRKFKKVQKKLPEVQINLKKIQKKLMEVQKSSKLIVGSSKKFKLFCLGVIVWCTVTRNRTVTLLLRTNQVTK